MKAQCDLEMYIHMLYVILFWFNTLMFYLKDYKYGRMEVSMMEIL